MRKFSALILTVTVLVFVSCQKEVDNQFDNNGNGGSGGNNGGSSQTLVGDYDFNGIGANVLTTITVSAVGQDLKAVTTSDYFSKNNVGTAKITSNQIILQGVGYDIDTVVHVVTYLNGSVFDDSEQPFQESIAPANDTLNYVSITADSISITSGDFVPAGSAPVTTGPIGARVAWSGDTLLLKFNSTFNTTVTQGGIPGQLTGSMDGVIKFKKH